MVREGDVVLEVRYRDEWKLGNALPLLEEAVVIGDEPPEPDPLVLEVLR